MSRTGLSLLGFVLVVALALVVVAAPVYAQSGTGPDDALEFDVWRTLDFNQEQWMCFNYEGDESDIELDVFNVPGNSVEVRVRTPENITTWQEKGENPCVGCGTADPIAKGDLHWMGSFNTEGMYCVTVKHNRSRPQPVYYRASIQGEGVSFPEPTMAEPMRAAAPAAAPAPAESREMAGSGPDYAMVPGNWTELGFNEIDWYLFEVTDADADVRIELFIDGDEDAADFLVRMPEDVRVWRDTGENPCIGCGTGDEFVQGDKSWRGVFNTKGLVWVTVHDTRLREAPIYYRLVIAGDGISFPTMDAPPVAEPTIAQAAEAPVAAEAAEVTMAGDGPDTAVMVDGMWRKIEGGEEHWYMLPVKKNKRIEVNIYGAPADVASFTIRTAADVDVWRRTGEDPCVGCGTPNEVAKGDFFWTGMFNQEGTVWIVVKHLNRRDGAAGFYRIVADGPGVGM